MSKKTILSVFDDSDGMGIMSFAKNNDIPGMEERKVNELSGLYNIVAEQMYHARFFGCADIEIESGDHAGKSFSVTITEPR